MCSGVRSCNQALPEIVEDVREWEKEAATHEQALMAVLARLGV
ncbi:MAG: hypothetical protein U1F76_28540 [Candidatus Competibacteraceae bacterium]